jgi:hypothetical protein
MLYAQITGKDYVLPMQWDKCYDMYKYLKRMTWGYQFIAERKMFQVEGPEYRCVLVRWVHDLNMWEKRREVLLETSDPKQMEVALFMLINEAEAQAKANKQEVTHGI